MVYEVRDVLHVWERSSERSGVDSLVVIIIKDELYWRRGGGNTAIDEFMNRRFRTRSVVLEI